MEKAEARAERILKADKDKLTFEEKSTALYVKALRFSSEQCSILDMVLCINSAYQLAQWLEEQDRMAEKCQLFIWLYRVLRSEINKPHRSYLYRKCCMRKISDINRQSRQDAKTINNLLPFLQPLPTFSYKSYS